MVVSEVVTIAARMGYMLLSPRNLAVILKARQTGLQSMVSTQANITNHKTAEFYRTLGAKLIVLSRELSIK